MTCEGNCPTHAGKVRRCLVSRNIYTVPWKFNYCKAARDEMRRYGFKIWVEEKGGELSKQEVQKVIDSIFK